MNALVLLFAAIQLSGVVGNGLRARAFFDANNVKIGDPMVLTIDFLGEAEFRDLHPPSLAKAVDRRDWKLDDVSAKTDTFRDAKRLTYRVRPMREGVLWFPSLEFEYTDAGGGRRMVRSNDIPVHAKAGAEVVVEEMGEDANAMPQPPDLILSMPEAAAGNEDLAFAWRKACASPSADGFAAFDFPEASLNEATCAICDGNWARAMKIYGTLEWRIGQTPDIERGLVAALALKYDNPAVELPVWRQVLRPILKYGLWGRLGIVLGGFALLYAVFYLLGKGIKAVACLAALLAFVPSGASAQGLFQQMEEQMQRMHQQMQQMTSGFSFHFGEKEEREPVVITASATMSKKLPQVGERFEFIISLEAPKTSSIGQIRIMPSEMFGLQVTGPAQNLTDGETANISNVVKRIAVPVRYDVPFKGKIAFAVEGMVSGRQVRNGGRFSFSYSNSFRSDTDPIDVEIRPLSTTGQPDGFSGIISEGLRLHETCDILRVETNDVITVTYRLIPNGYVPDGYLPPGVAFEWMRQTDREGKVGEIEYKRYFVADGAPRTPVMEISYYDPRTKAYKKVKAGGTALKYDIMK